jgi:hypothetical protein
MSKRERALDIIKWTLVFFAMFPIPVISSFVWVGVTIGIGENVPSPYDALAAIPFALHVAGLVFCVIDEHSKTS